MIFEPTVLLSQSVHLSYDKMSTLSKQTKNKLPVRPHHLGVPDASKMIFEPMVLLAQTVDLSCTNTNSFSKRTQMRFQMTHVTKTNTASKRTETRFHRTHVTKEFHQVHPKQPSQWYFRCKPCTNLVLGLSLSPNKPKRASSWASSPRSTFLCVQNNF
jgi:hypothetical protein